MAVQIVGHREAKEVKETLLSHEDMLKIKSSMGISGRATISLAKDLRSARKNRKLVQPGMKHALKEHIHKLDGVFTIKKLGESEVPVIFCNDIEECLNIVQKERGIDIENSDLKVGLDAGGGFLKVCLNVLTDEEVPARKRLHFEDGISPKKFRSTSVRKLIILAIVPGIKENYENVANVLTVLNFHDIPSNPTVRYAADLKMINLLLGLMSAASRFPCSWCDMNR